MAASPKKDSSDFKVKVALEAMKGQKTINEVSSEYRVHPTQITQWKKQALDELPTIFALPGSERVKNGGALVSSFYQQIGQEEQAGIACRSQVTERYSCLSSTPWQRSLAQRKHTHSLLSSKQEAMGKWWLSTIGSRNGSVLPFSIWKEPPMAQVAAEETTDECLSEQLRFW
jgi:transposase